MTVSPTVRIQITMFACSLIAGGCMSLDLTDDGAERATDPDVDRIHGDASEYIYDPADIYTHGVNGHLWIGARHSDYSDESYDTFSANARFFNVDIETDPSEYKEVINEIEGINDCGLQIINAGGIENDMIAWWDAGEVSLSWGPHAVLLSETRGASIYYDADLRALGHEPRFDTAYTFRATGGAAPAMSQSITLPADIELSIASPKIVTTPIREELTLEWTGATFERAVRIVYSAARYTVVDGGYSVAPPYYDIVCVADDDGRFTIPAMLLQQIPDDYAAELSIRRGNADFVEISGGLDIFMAAAASHSMLLGVY